MPQNLHSVAAVMHGISCGGLLENWHERANRLLCLHWMCESAFIGKSDFRKLNRNMYRNDRKFPKNSKKKEHCKLCRFKNFFPLTTGLLRQQKPQRKAVQPTLPESRITLPIMVPKSRLLSRKAVSVNLVSMAQLVMAMTIRAERFWIKS